MKGPRPGTRVIGHVCTRGRRGGRRGGGQLYACHVCEAEGKTHVATVICDECDGAVCPEHVGEHRGRSAEHPDGYDRCSVCAGGVLPLATPRTP